MLIRLWMGQLPTSNAKRQWQKYVMERRLVGCQAQETALAGTESNRTRTEPEVTSSRTSELPDRGRTNETKTVTDPHSKPVQE